MLHCEPMIRVAFSLDLEATGVFSYFSVTTAVGFNLTWRN
jgi:hypothetical protein